MLTTFVMAIALAATAQAAQDTEEETAPETQVVEKKQKDKDAPDYMRCRRVQVTGTLLKKRICKTNAQWAAQAQTGQTAANEIMEMANKGYTRSD